MKGKAQTSQTHNIRGHTHTHTGRSESTIYTQWKGLGYSIQYTATHHTML